MRWLSVTRSYSCSISCIFVMFGTWPERECVLFIGTQFSNLSTAVILLCTKEASQSPFPGCSLRAFRCKKHGMDLYGDHTSTCTAHSGATKAHDWAIGMLGPLFPTA